MARPKSADPLLSALIKKLPPGGTDWPVEQQLAWLNLMAMAFGTVYGGDAAVRFGQSKNPNTIVGNQFRPVEHSFYIDKNGFARKRGGQRVLPKDVSGTLHDLRGIDGDANAIVWADDTMGLGAAGEIMVSAA